VAEAIRKAMAEARPAGVPVPRQARVTVSVGVAAFPAHAADAVGLLAQADKALYVAKRSGKDCVRVYA
jgi:diguanylate cyclase (GGDEF)-like protein